MNMLKRSLAMLLVLVMLFSVVPLSVFADETAQTTAQTEVTEPLTDAGDSQGEGKDEDSTSSEATEEVTEATEETTEVTEETTEATVEATEAIEEATEATEEATEPTEEATEPAEELEPVVFSVRSSSFLKVFHLDCGRKYFTVDQIKELIDAISNVGFSHMELAIGNDGLRLLLDDMSVSANGTTYDSETIKSGIKSGNSNYSHSGEWTQTEMDEIIAYAKTKGIEIIPLVNNPGHMDSILAAMEACGIDGYYADSSRTVDLENEEAVAFTQALVLKYAEYFASKGCSYFNIGADEYANDYHTDDSTGMGFGYLIDNNKYGNFITYVNALVEDIMALGMTPIAFNDGIYFREDDSFGEFNSNLMVAAWTSGWGGIEPASTTFLANKGHQLLNTNERWYYVLGRKQASNSTYCYESALSNAKSERVTTVTDREGNTPIGAMQCVWCDNPSVDYETYKSNVMTLISTLAEYNPTYFTGPNVVEPETVTKKDEETGISASAPGLSDLTITEIEDAASIPAIDGAVEVLAYDVAAFVDGESYTGEITISVPVPAEWTRVRGGVLASDSGEEVLGIEGKLENGVFTFVAPHLSGVVTYAVDYDEPIELEVGGTEEIVVQNEDLSGTYTPDPAGVANVTVEYEQVDGETIYELGDQITPTNDSGWSDTGVIKSGDYYLVMDGTSLSATTDIAEATVFTVTRSSSYRWTIQSGNYFLRYNNSTLSGSTSSYEWRYSDGFCRSNYSNYLAYSNSSWGTSADYNSSSKAYLYDVSSSTTDPVNQSTITFTGVAAGETYVEVGGIVYKIVVSKKAESATITVGETKTYTDSSTNAPTVADTSVAEAELVNGTLTITAKAVGTTTITTDNAVYTITVVELDLSNVDPLEIEYWITNHPVTPNDQDVITSYVDHEGETQTNEQKIYIEIPATTEIHSQNGVALNTLVAPAGVDSHITTINVVFWKGVALDTDEYQQTTDANDNESFNGIDFTRVRYWNSAWQVFDGTNWVSVTDTTQIVAYYLQKTIVTNLDVIQTEVVDWGEVYGVSSWSDSKFVALDFAVQYENGTRNPDAFAVSGKTMLFHCDYNSALNATVFQDSNGYYRRIGTIRATETSNYEVYMITLTPNSDTPSTEVASSAGSVDEIEYGGTEKVVWVDNVANLGEFEDTTLQHEDFTVGGDPIVQKIDIYNQQAVLVTYYVRAKVTPDSLTVHYIDEAAGDVEFYNYNIAVNKGTYFNENIALPTPWKGDLVNGTVQTIDASVKQTVSSDLSTLPAVAAQYLYSEYECVRIELKYTTITNEDGSTSSVPKDLYLYYTFDPTVTFVADFGLPLEIKATDLSAKLDGIVEDMAVTGGSYTTYGQLIDNGTSITYKPTKIMQGSDFFTILVTTTEASGILDETAKQVAFRVYVVPATTVFYEESFITWDSNWSGGNEAVTVGNQTTEVLGAKVNNFGYDPIYANTTGASNGTNATTGTIGAKGTFTFTGNGIQVFANATKESGYVSVQVVNSSGKIVNVAMVDTIVDPGTTGATTGQTGNLYGLPIVSLIDLTNMPHDTYTVTITKIMDSETVYIDGIRVFNTVEDSTIFVNDLEDKPDFYELRDAVLHVMGVGADTSVDYKTMYEQVYNAVADADALITDESVTYDESATLQDLLDNGPKNEIYLYAGQTLTFKVKTNRVMQVGLKAPQGATTVDINVTNGKTETGKAIGTSVDMFYTLADKATAETTYTVKITNSGDKILSVTELKICDDPNATFVPFTFEEIKEILGGAAEEVPPAEPDQPEQTGVPGDLNADGVFDEYDVARLLWYVLFPDAYTLSGDADFTGDGVVNEADVAYLLWHMLFPEFYPLN